MNTVEPYSMTSPNYKTEECAKFTIDDVSQVFSINEVMVIGREYTFSGWVRSDTASSMIVEDKAFSTTTEWAYVMHTFIADQVDLHFAFVDSGAYYIYHVQLELGNKATDWDVAPEDVDTDIGSANASATTAQNAANEAGNRATNAQNAADAAGSKADNAQSTANEAQSAAAAAQNTAAEAKLLAENKAAETLGALEALKKEVGAITPIAGYVKITPADASIELGDLADTNAAKLRLTNNELIFVDNNANVAWMTAKKLHISNARIEDELEIGGFVWTEHATKTASDGVTVVKSRTGLLWKGGS